MLLPTNDAPSKNPPSMVRASDNACSSTPLGGDRESGRRIQSGGFDTSSMALHIHRTGGSSPKTLLS